MNNNVYEFRYLDKRVEENRKNILWQYIIENKTDLLDVYGFSFLGGLTSTKSKIIKSICKSKIDQQIILNNYQLELLSILLNGKNLFLSAPTSFGKTFVVLEYIKRSENSLKNIVFVVPTIALMNELVFKINKVFSESFNICVNEQETLSDKNIFVFVPERSGKDFLKRIKEQNIEIDLLVFDEIYKLNRPNNPALITNDDRIIVMNRAYLKMVSVAKQIILLGPFIKDVKFERTKLDIVKYYTNFLPVYNKTDFSSQEQWINILKSNNKCLVYFHSPSSIYNAVKELISLEKEDESFCYKYQKEIAYLEKRYSKDWFVIDSLKRGYGIHHGKIEMYLRRFFEDQYRKNELRGLFCTSTLMEGINTPTQSLIIMEKTKDAFELNNLIGRVGRLTSDKPSIGHIYICDDNAKALFNNSDTNDWITLKILAESSNAINNEESLFLEKEIGDQKKKKEFEKKLNEIIQVTGKTKSEIAEGNVKFVSLYKYVSNGYSTKFKNARNLYECVSFAYELLGKKLDFLFKPSNYINLSLNREHTFSAIIYMQKLLCGESIKSCVDDFNSNFNKTTNKTNINQFIDSLNEITSYIKFKLVRMCDVFSLFNVDTNENKSLQKFVNLLGIFSQSDIVNKILEDLGIEESDFAQIRSVLNIDPKGKVSTSIVIREMKNNKDSILALTISPFTRRNVLSICE